MRKTVLGLAASLLLVAVVVWVFKGCSAAAPKAMHTANVWTANPDTSIRSTAPLPGPAITDSSSPKDANAKSITAGTLTNEPTTFAGVSSLPNNTDAPLAKFGTAQSSMRVPDGGTLQLGGQIRHGQAVRGVPGQPRNAQIAFGVPSDEIWVISKPPEDRLLPHSDQPMPGEGQLMARRNEIGGEKLVPVPLKHTDVKASVIGYIASVDVQQQYQNPFGEKIEAVYEFPLPQNAAVNEFIMTVGERRIHGIIRERQEAEQIYHEAKSQGYVASLLTQERPNVFTQAIANIEPGKKIDIDIKYFNTLSYVDGYYEFVFPMVVGPRFNPPGYTNGIGAVARGSGGASGEKTEIQYLAPNERSGHDISLAVDINAGVPIESINSPNHKVDARQVSPNTTRITLDPADSIPNRDFVLRYKVAGSSVKPALIAQRNGDGGYFTLMLFPPEFLKDIPRQPLEFVFTIDVSGSQSGRPLEQAKAATRYALTHMGRDDTFQVIRFGNTAQKLFAEPAPVTADAVRNALQWVDGFDANEGTMLIPAVHASLLFPHDESRTRYVAFMTDGFIGNDTEAIAEVHKCLGPARLFSFGVGQSTNRYLLDGMARMGRGAVAYLGLNDDANTIMAQYFDRISHPALSDIAIDWGNAKVSGVFPAQIPDLYVGRPVMLTGKYEGELPAAITIRAKIGGRIQELQVPVQIAGAQVDEKALPAVWARMKITDLADRAAVEGGIDLPTQIRQIAMDYNLMSAYTAFVAVDSMTRTAGDHGVTVAVPVPVPEGVRYETTVQEAGNLQRANSQ
jgi:Ca-activated chloride channel family protein